MATNPRPVEALELQAERERERIKGRVAEIRYGLEQRLDVRRIAEERIHERPGAIYGAAAALAALIGYIFARLLKT
ncbi:MAG TPA: hypothetical protein VGS10_00245 [Terracidiphilus sp.]|nr:hypothetical protein [Terracidiphilus sp.]